MGASFLVFLIIVAVIIFYIFSRVQSVLNKRDLNQPLRFLVSWFVFIGVSMFVGLSTIGLLLLILDVSLCEIMSSEFISFC